jgi:hypothetical protein
MLRLIATLVVAAVLIGCGDGDDGDDRAAKSTTASATATAAPATALPAELTGTWKTRLPVSELPDPPNELNDASAEWTLTIAADGGVDDGPTFTLANDAVGPMFSPVPTASGGRITLEDASDECRGRPMKSTYAFVVEGEELTFQPPDLRDCEDVLTDAILSARPWRRAQ